MSELLEPIENEVEKYTEDDYDQMLDECYPDCNVAGIRFNTSYALKELDPTAYSCGFSDYQEYETEYECPICGLTYSDEDEAKYCCQTEEEEEEED